MAHDDPPVRSATVVITKVHGKASKRTANVIGDAIYNQTGDLPVQTSFSNVDVLPISVAAGVTRPEEEHASVVSLVYDNASFTSPAVFREELELRMDPERLLDIRVVTL